MSIAAIIVNYNAGEWLLRSVRSAVQDKAISIVYVVDNDSSDNSLEQLDALDFVSAEHKNKLKLLKNTHNLGFGKANNIALQKVMSEPEIKFVLLLNPDFNSSDLSAKFSNTMDCFFADDATATIGYCEATKF